MSTYTDLHNRAKETINVDYHTRVTPQKVHFINSENSYNGTFIGKIVTDGNNSINGGVITNVVLSNSILDNVKFKSGVDLDKIDLEINTLHNTDAELCSLIEEETEARINALDIETLERKNADIAVSVDLTKDINFVNEQSQLRDTVLNTQINQEQHDRISSDSELEKRVNDKMLHDRHLEMHLIDNREFPLEIHDYAINTYVDSNANAFVYVNGNIDDKPIGKIEKAVFDDDKLVSFEFNAFANHPTTHELTAAGIFQYYFDKDNTVKYTGVGGYRLQCDVAKSTTLENTQFTLDSANNNGYYEVNFESGVKAATIDANCKIDSFGMLSSCSLTITAPQLSNFALTTPFVFTSNGETKTFKGRNGNWCEAVLSDNVFSLYDKHTTRYFIPVRDSETDVIDARIYDGNVILAYDGSLAEVGVDTEVGKHYKLNVENGFKLPVDAATPYTKIAYLETDNTIQIKEEKKYYKYSFNGSAGSLIPGIADIPNKRIDDAYSTVGINLTIDSPSLAEYVNGDYVLELVDAVNKYQIEKEIFKDNFGKIKITFVKDIRTVFVDIMPNATADFIHLRFDINNIIAPIEIDESRILFTSKKLCDDIKHARLDEKILDEHYDFKYELIPNLVEKHYSGESTVVISQAKTNKKDTVTVLLPNKEKQIPCDYDTAASKFILNFKVYTESLQDESFVTVLIKSCNSVDKFYYMNKEVRKIFIKKNKWTTLQFEEIRPHRYIINDLDYSEIDWRLTWLHDRLSADEISVAININNLSTDVAEISSELSTAIQRNRDDVSFFGDVVLSDKYDEHDIHNHLSDLVATNADTKGKVQYGFMYRCKAPVGREADIFYIWNDKDANAALKDNMYFVVNRKTETDTIPLNELKYTDVAFFNNFDIDVANLSTYAREIELSAAQISSEVDRLCSEISNDITSKYDKLTADDNFISGEVGRLCAEISNDLTAKYVDLTSTVSSLCTTVSTDFVNRLTANDILGYNKFIGDVSAANVSVENQTVGYLSANNVEFTNLTVHGKLIAADKEVDAEITHLSSASADIDVVNALTSNLTVANIIDANITNLSIDSNNLKLTDRLSSLNEELSDLEAKTDFLLSVGHRSMEYWNDVRSIEYKTHENADLSDWLKDNFNNITELSNGLKQGFTFRLNAEQKLYKRGSETPYVILNANDYFIAKHEIRPLDIAKFEDFAVIYDAYGEGSKLCTDLSIKIDNLELSVANLSDIVDELCSEISNDITTKYEWLSAEISANDKFISGEVGRLCAEISNDLTAKYEKLSADDSFISGKVDRLCSEISTDLTAKYDKLTTDDSFISTEVERLCAEISTDLTAKYEWLSAEISANDKFISGEVGRLCAEISNDLTAKYEKLSADDSFISGKVDRLCSEISTDLTAKYDKLTTDDSFISTEVERLCAEISTDLTAKYEWLSNEISANDNDISTLNDNLDKLSAHYHKTVTEVEYKTAAIGEDLCVDVLNIVDGDNTNNKYTLQFLSGTLVLVPISK